MPQTPIFKVDGVTAPGAPGLVVVVAARNPARPLIAAGGDVTLAIGARGTPGARRPGVLRRRAAPCRRRPTTSRASWCCATARWCRACALNPDGSAVSPGAPSLVVEHPFAKVTLERCITGPLQ